VLLGDVTAGRGRRQLSELVGHYEPVYYDRHKILQRTTRSTNDDDAPTTPLRFTMHAYGRYIRHAYSVYDRTRRIA